jgi:hypothetical protein
MRRALGGFGPCMLIAREFVDGRRALALDHGLESPQPVLIVGVAEIGIAARLRDHVRLAKLFQSERDVHQRLQELSKTEADIIAAGDDQPRMHS